MRGAWRVATWGGLAALPLACLEPNPNWGGFGAQDATGEGTGCERQVYADEDNDGFGDPDRPRSICEAEPGDVDNTDDCDDTNTQVNPDADELCDGIDNDCDGRTDEHSTANQSCNGCRSFAGSPVVHACAGTIDWADAAAACEVFGAQLGTPCSAAETATFTSAMDNAFGASSRAWIGVNDRNTEGTFTDVQGTPLWSGGATGGPIAGAYTNWSPGEPNGQAAEDCVEMFASGAWNDNTCDSTVVQGWLCAER